jgi:hypothetical protein
MDATGAENHTTVLVIEPSPLERNMLWAATDDGRVHYTQNGGASWIEVSKNLKDLPAGSWIVQIKASNKNKGEAFLVANDYRRFNYTPYVYRTKNYGKTWERIVDSNDVISYALSIVEDPIEKNLIFLGTDDGLYISIDAGNSWTKWTHHFPTVSVKDLVIHPREHDLVIGTFGRAAWVLDDIRPLRALAKDKSLMTSDIMVFEPPTAYQAAYQQPTGSRFGGDALFNGENRDSGALIKFYFQKKEEEKVDDKEDTDSKDEDEETEDASEEKTGPSKDSIYLKIYDDTRLIRTLKRKIPDSTGIYTWKWRLDEAGVDRPSRKIRKRINELGGTTVKPGIYKVDLEFNGNTTSTTIKVQNDPRLKISQKAIDEGYAASKNLEAMTQTAADAVKQLVESKNTANDLSKMLKEDDSKKYKEEIDMSKKITKKIDSIIALYIGKEDKRQGITRNPETNVMQRLGSAGWYSGSRPNGMTNTETLLMKHAKDALNDALMQTNNFFDTDWKIYKTRLEQAKVSPFKNLKKFSLD